MSRTIGYARVSTDEQTTALQLDALRRAGCEAIFEDQGVSGTTQATTREGLGQAVSQLTAGDVLVVWRLDRLGRSLPDLVQTVSDLGARGVHVRSLSESIDTTTAAGKLIFHVFCSLAQFERDLIAERTKAGLAAARERGVQLGRPHKLNERQITFARGLLDTGKSRGAVAKALGVSYVTLWRALAQEHKE